VLAVRLDFLNLFCCLLDTSRLRSARLHAADLSRKIIWSGCLRWWVLGGLRQPIKPEGIWVRSAGLHAYYFLHFLVILIAASASLSGPLPLPESISRSVMAEADRLPSRHRQSPRKHDAPHCVVAVGAATLVWRPHPRWHRRRLNTTAAARSFDGLIGT